MGYAVNKTFSQYKFGCHNVIPVVAVSSIKFLSKIDIYKIWIKVLILRTQLGASTKL